MEQHTLEFGESDHEIKLDGEVYMTARLLSEKFGLSANRIARLARTGVVDEEFLGGRRFISYSSLDRYLLDRQRKSARFLD